MSCFWDALFSSLTDNDYKFLYIKIHDIHNNMDKIDREKLKVILCEIKKTNLCDLVKLLIKFNCLCKEVQWNGEELGEQLLKENYEHIKDFIENNGKDLNSIINSGYLCSVCDPFLILICQLFRLEIHHKYLDNTMIYKNTINCRRIIRFKSNRGHFQVL